MKLKILVLALLVSGLGWSQVFTATYDFASVTMTSGTTDPTPVPTAANITFGSFVAIGTPANPNASFRFSFTDWATGATNGSDLFVGAINTGEYYQVTLTPSVGYNLDLNSITFTIQRSGTGIRQYAVRSSLDSYANNLPASINPANTNLSVVATNIFQIVDTATGANGGSTITLNASYDAITTPITFRFYGFNAEASGGTFSIDDVVFNGVMNVAGITSAQTGNWSDTTTWVGGVVPTSANNAIIASGHTVTMDSATYSTRNVGTSTIVNSGGILATNLTYTNNGTTTINGSFQLNTGGWATGSNFTYGANGTLIFNKLSGGSYNVNNVDVFWPATNSPFNVTNLGQGVTINSMTRTVAGVFETAAGVTLNSPSTLILNGICRINVGGFFNQSPIYGNASTLIYNSGGTYGRGNEWQALGVGTIGTTPGYPNNVQLTGTTTLNYNNGTPLAKAIHGNLTIDTGSSFYMDFGGGASGGALTVAGNINNAGNFTLGNAIGDDLRLGGNFTQTGAGTFNGNNRAVFFTRNGTQTVSSVTPLTIPYVVFNPTSGSTTLQLLSNLIISAPAAGNAISFSSDTDILDINSQNLTIGTTGFANTINGLGTFRGTTTSNLTLLGTGSIGTLRFTTGQQILRDLTLNRQSSVIGFELGTTLSINGVLSLTNGLIQLNDQTMIFTTNGSVVDNNSSNYVIADFDLGGRIQKNINSASLSFTFPIGDSFSSADGSQYAPASINFTNGTFSGASVSVSVRDVKHPNMDATSDYISRYWVVTRAGTFTDPVYNFIGTYLPIDIVGTEGNSSSQQWDGSVWSVSGTNLLSGTTMTMNGITELPTTNHFTAGLRTPEIRVERSTNAEIPSGSVPSAGFDTVFAAQNIGNSGTKTYRIVNIGTANLNVSSITLGGVNPLDFSVNAATPFVITPGSFVTFTVTFAPTISGVLTAQLIIANNDVNESSYTFGVQGTGNCNASNAITPASGPVGTEITITATTNNLTSASVSFNGIPAASVTQISSTQIKATVPIGATSGVITTTNSSGCSVSNPFTVIDNFTSGCEGGAVGTELFISEVTDATAGGLTYIEIYNPTANPIQLNEYSIRIFSNGLTTSTIHNLNNFLLNPGDVYVFAVGVSSNPSSSNTCSIDGGNGQLANQTTTLAGINFVDGSNQSLGHDHIALYKNSTKIDSWGVYENESWATSLGLGTRGANFRRRNDVLAPNITYSNTDWEIFDWEGEGQTSCFTNDYSDIGSYSFLAGNPPTVTTQPIYSPSCRSTVLSVTSVEGFSGGNALSYQWYVVAPNQAVWSALLNDSVYSGVQTNTLTISNITGLDGYQYYCQVMENTATCYVASNAVKILEPQTTTWNGAWTPGTPNSTTKVIFASNYTTSASGNIEACECLVNTGVDVTINSGDYFEIQSKVTVNGTLTIENNGSLVQVENVTNEGAINYIREADNVNIYDYVYWSSPVAGFSLADVTGTANRYRWLTTAPNSNGGLGNWSGYSGTMELGKGYIVRVPNTFPEASSSGNAIETLFNGVPNNGTINVDIFRGNMTTSTVPSVYSNTQLSVLDDNWNLVGNPYPSALNVELFLQRNAIDFPVIEGAVRLWTHGSPPSSGNANPFYGTYTYNYSPNDYIVHNFLGATPGPEGFNGNIATGQGFFVLMNEGEAATAQLRFSNSMRDKGFDNSQFYRQSEDLTTETEQKHRIWLDIIASNGIATRTLVGYIPNATVAKDVLYDAYTKPGTLLNIYSLIGNETVGIQGRPTPFEVIDQVPIGFVAPQNSTYTIAIHAVDGLFSNGGQTIYLEDTLLNQIHNLSVAPYVFTSAVGTFNTRFILRYTNETLSTPEINIANQLWVYVSDGINVQSQLEELEQVTVYDLLGKRLYEANANQLLTHKITQIQPNKQVLFVQVTLSNGSVVTKKVVY
jgi:Lamin Tail Domain/Abnormal spindle-like microcephaly-assoc'd, ASPM-SPD-2-Hydin